MPILEKVNTLKLKIAIVLCTIAFSCFGQNIQIDSVDKAIQNGNYKKAISVAMAIDTTKVSSYHKGRLQSLMAEAYKALNSEDLEFEYLIRARDNYTLIDSVELVRAVNLRVIHVLVNNTNDYATAKQYVEEYLQSVGANDHELLSRAYMELGGIMYNTNAKEALNYFKRALQENSYTNDELLRGRIYHSLGACYATSAIMQPDSALYVYKEAIAIYKKFNEKSRVALIHINRGVAYTKLKNYKKALEEFKIADSCDLDQFKISVKSYIQKYQGDTYKEMGDYKSALAAYEREQVIIDSLKIEDQKKSIKDIETKYKTAEKELENQKLASEVRVKNIYLVAFSGLLLLLFVIGALGYNYISKKRKIAEQEKTIEKQKRQTLLREQELHEIDVMLESQEKERQRIANDLHDNLGSLLSALKLNFHTLGKREKEKETALLYEKTEQLINETYTQVRNISHLKNLGVVGNEGLLVAVKKMAEKMSVINRLQFNVIPFGLSGRLESNTEITLFRMIQELCSNIIKHSEATEVNIYLTQHEDHQLNVMIEDNGKGFDTAVLRNTNSGIGLKNIEKKVEQLGGTFTIDSAQSKGTTIIIDIPL